MYCIRNLLRIHPASITKALNLPGLPALTRIEADDIRLYTGEGGFSFAGGPRPRSLSLLRLRAKPCVPRAGRNGRVWDPPPRRAYWMRGTLRAQMRGRMRAALNIAPNGKTGQVSLPGPTEWRIE